MIKAVTVNSTPCWLIACEIYPAVQWTVSRLVSITAGKTQIEDRQVLGATLRNKLDFKVAGWDQADEALFFAALVNPSNKPVLCPCWPCAVPYGKPALATSGLRITYEPDFSLWEVHTAATPSGFSPSANAWTAPLLWGRWERRPEVILDNAVIFDGALSFLETGPATYAITPVATVQTGPSVNSETPPLLNFDFVYDGAKLGTELVVMRERLGYGRDEAETFHTHTPQRTLQLTMGGDSTDMIRLVASFHAAGGNVAPVWFPSLHSPCRLAANTSAGSALITVDAASRMNGHPYLILRNAYGTAAARAITQVAGNTLTLSSSPGALNAETTSLQLLLLGRFRSEELTLTWRGPGDVSSSFALREIPADYSAPAGEVYGTTYGRMAPVLYLLKVTDQIGGTWYWTNYESAVTVNGQTWTPTQWQWDQIDEGLNFDDEDISFKCDAWTGNPFMRLLTPRRGQQLEVELLEWDLTAASASTLAKGTVRSCRRLGKTLQFRSKGVFRRLYDQKVPRRIDSVSCSNIPYDTGCGMSPAAKAKAGTLVSQVSTYVVRVQLGVASAVHAFAGGWMARTNPGTGGPTYAILDSTVSASNALDITLDQPLVPALAAGEAVTLYPGCDCSWAACAAHGNTANYWGAPDKPDANPAFVAIKNTTSSGSKK